MPADTTCLCSPFAFPSLPCESTISDTVGQEDTMGGKRVLIAGESWIMHTIHQKGFDHFTT